MPDRLTPTNHLTRTLNWRTVLTSRLRSVRGMGYARRLLKAGANELTRFAQYCVQAC